ncbi:hypothetical protein AVEN_263068-1 [Araneus ventricosus]|uniref:Uncharacterized protein n=1 Tax=Araneus ventricosus TaxID=182803 RepID=A0A4Y2MSQ9_ARAVE|nr:hypothetical protein AVEN_263068-1 [Araneus ventricosus]
MAVQVHVYPPGKTAARVTECDTCSGGCVLSIWNKAALFDAVMANVDSRLGKEAAARNFHPKPLLKNYPSGSWDKQLNRRIISDAEAMCSC